MEEKPIKTEVKNEETLEIKDIVIDNKPLNEEIEKDIPDFVNVNNFVGTIPDEELREIYHCTYCNKRYIRFVYLQIHEYIHDQQKHCPICNFSFKAKKDFIVHINGHIKEKMEDERRSLFCDFCKKSFKKRRALILHLRVHTNERPYKCNICGKAFKQKGSLSDHNTTHTNVKAFPCEICSGSFTTASSLKRHIKRIHDAGKTYFCKICSQKVENYNALQQHRAEQHPEASEHRQCSICPMIFKSSYSFKKHKKEHANNGEFQEGVYRRKDKCYLCGEKFQNYKLYIQHKDYHLYYDKEDFQRAQKNGSFTCKLCQREFQNKQGLFQHMPFHMEKTEKCNICQEFFTYYGYSNHKRRVHLPLECKICKEVVEGKAKLYNHYRTTHSDLNRLRDRNYSCHVCNKTYKSKYPLEIHMQIYHEKSEIIKTHKCNVCGKQFTTRASLGGHMTLVHSTSARFKCDSCNIVFHTRSKFLAHNLNYHGRTIKKWRKKRSRLCTICNQEFRTFSLLQRHKTTKHKKPTTQFQCKICFKYFKNFRNRIVHLENKVCTKFFEKTKIKLYKCSVCQETFVFRHLLTTHMVVHSKFHKTCRFCSKTFTKTSYVRTHVKNVHPLEKAYYCGFCDMEFEDLSQLKYHRHSPTHIINIDSKIEVERDCEVKSHFDEEDIEVKKEPVE